ncbi:hypothetical protein T4E_12155 [Trichinella pseudospiralis]|uniref:Uncharacterized protein n=1 Tax=Trichinella pseudospiralis TaxID=6337 RepID=A0A0V0YN57_TRIPS|nr:hypothetical protein T4E_12155 [Trichinella pseudospiralis]
MRKFICEKNNGDVFSTDETATSFVDSNIKQLGEDIQLPYSSCFPETLRQNSLQNMVSTLRIWYRLLLAQLTGLGLQVVNKHSGIKVMFNY